MGWFNYWGKFKKPIELDYARGVLSDAEIVAKYDSLDSIEQLKQQAKKHYWSKSKRPEQVIPYHLLAFHSLDVAAIGALCYRYNLFGARQLFVDVFGSEAEAYFQLFLFALALHDIGKFGRSFQSLKPEEHAELVQSCEQSRAQKNGAPRQPWFCLC